MTKQFLFSQCLRAGSPLPLRTRLSHEKKEFLHVVLAFSYARTRGCSAKLLFSLRPPLLFASLFARFLHPSLNTTRRGLVFFPRDCASNPSKQTEQPPRRGVAPLPPPPFSSRLENSKVPSPLRTCVQGKKKGVGEVMNLHKRGWGRKEGE